MSERGVVLRRIDERAAGGRRLDRTPVVLVWCSVPSRFIPPGSAACVRGRHRVEYLFRFPAGLVEPYRPTDRAALPVAGHVSREL